MYTLIGSPMNRTFRVLWALEELEQPYTRQIEQPRSAAVCALSPLGKVPILLVDGEPVTDSVAILTYLADRHGGLTHPAGTLARARQDALTHQVLDEIEALIWTAARHTFILPEERRVPDIKPALRWEYEKNLTSLATRLADQPYLAGEEMTVPDILALHCLNWAAAARFPEPPAPLAAYAARLRARPGYKRAVTSEKTAQAA